MNRSRRRSLTNLWRYSVRSYPSLSNAPSDPEPMFREEPTNFFWPRANVEDHQWFAL